MKPVIWSTCRGFKKRGGRTAGPTSPVEGICCPHGRLLPEASGVRAKRASVPQTVWSFITEQWGVEMSQPDAPASSAPSEGTQWSDTTYRLLWQSCLEDQVHKDELIFEACK